MSEAAKQKPIPAPPEGVTDKDQITNGEERWAECPLRDCKSNPALLYEDFQLRGMRSNRLLCSKCAVRVEVGYMAREEVRKHDDRYFTATTMDDFIVLALMFFFSLIGNILAVIIPSFYIEIALGAAIGAGVAALCREITQKRVSRETQYWAVGGILAGALLAYVFGRRSIVSVIILSGAMIAASWGIFLRRI